MKKIVSILAVLLLTACDDPRPFCERDYDPVVCSNNGGYVQYDFNKEVFEICINALAKARGSAGGNYTTNDDEDLDDAIDSCRYTANSVDRRDICQPNPRYEAQKEHCDESTVLDQN